MLVDIIQFTVERKGEKHEKFEGDIVCIFGVKLQQEHNRTARIMCLGKVRTVRNLNFVLLQICLVKQDSCGDKKLTKFDDLKTSLHDNVTCVS